MIRKYFMRQKKKKEEKIYWRSHEVSRIEAISDAVFAFALSLLIISLEVPKNTKELFKMMHGLIPFAITCLIIFWLWRSQYRFFRRYGLHDDTTIYLNGILLLVVLSYVYPLKFLFSCMFMKDEYVIVDEIDRYWLVIVYNAGYVVFSLLFSLMYLNAARKKDLIKLTPVEVFETNNHAIYFAIPSVAAMLSIVIAYYYRYDITKINNYCLGYTFIGIAMPIIGFVRGRLYKKKFGNIPEVEPHHGTEG